jgi:cyclophilin family peptidyl-prolyl cis-trans isomerase
MSDRVPLWDYGNSRAVLVGTSAYRNLTQVPAAGHSLGRMHALLMSDLCGWPDGRITEIQDAAGPGDLHQRLIRLFRDVTGVALFYFVGHGQVDDRDRLCLGLAGSSTEPDLRASTSLEFEDVRDALLRSRAQTKILILDCCYSGLASGYRNTLGAEDIADLAGVAGAYTMTACQAYGTASFETDHPQPQTHFTKYLADLVEEGIPGEPSRLRLRAIFQRLSDRLAADGHPRPMERNINSASEFVLAFNAAPVQVQVDVPTALQQLDARLTQVEAALIRLGGPEAPAAAVPGPAAAPPVRSGPGPGPGPVGGVDGQLATLLTRAADLLRDGKGAEFRAVEAELQSRGSSARPQAVLETSFGPITVRLLPDYSAEAVRNFIELAEGTVPWQDPRHRELLRQGSRLYDGTLFHKVVRGLLIQGGDPVGTGHGGPGWVQAHETHRDLTFDRPHMMAMANSGPNSEGSQFFITVAPAPWLNYEHTIFGEVVAGAEVAERISAVAVDATDRPVDDVLLNTVRISWDARPAASSPRGPRQDG